MSTNATAERPAAVRKTGWSAAANASTYAWCAGAGSWATAAGSIPSGVEAPGGRSAESSTASRFAKIVPNSATPIEPPIERKRIGRTSPRRVRAVDGVLHGEHEHLHHPQPEADDEQSSDARAALVSASSWASRSIPTMTSAVPAIGNGR